MTAVFDQHAGRIVYVNSLGETWTFDVCTNTWYQMHPTGTALAFVFGGLVYDVDSDVTVALGFESVSVYDANTNTWTQPTNNLVGIGDGLIVPVGGAYDPISGLIITSASRRNSETNSDSLEFWAYDVDTFAVEVSGQADPIRTGALHPDPQHSAKPDQPTHQRLIAASVGRERLDPQYAAVAIDCCGHVNVGVGVHTSDRSGYHRHGCPFHSSMGKGVAHATGTAERDPTELVSAVQPDAHRPTGACNTNHIIPPSRIWAGGLL